MTLELRLNTSMILTEELKCLWNYFQILQEFRCRLVIPIGRSETLSDNQIAVKFQACKRTEMVSESFRNSFGIHLGFVWNSSETL